MANVVGVILIIAGLVLLVGPLDLPADVRNVVATETLGWLVLIAGVVVRLGGLARDSRRRRSLSSRSGRDDG